MNKVLYLLWFSFVCLASLEVAAQGYVPVSWHFDTRNINEWHAEVKITALLAPGWEIYSQYMPAGGPPCTRISFVPNGRYVLTGPTLEHGEWVSDNFNNGSLSYMREVTFVQGIQLTQPVRSISGLLEYMMCSTQYCVPQQQWFSVSLPALGAVWNTP